MDASLEKRITDRPEEESRRRGYPEGFPVLPPVPAARYADPAFFDAERRGVFGRSWLFVAHAGELPEPGDTVLLDQLSAPVFLVRGDDGEIRAFHNVCRHRGGPLVRERTGNVGGDLECGYHGWTYGLDGELRSVPQPKDFGGLDKSCLGLHAVRCEAWGPFVFVNLDPDAGPLADALGVVGDDLGPQVASKETLLVHRRSVEVEGNWKLIVDANVETYHVNTLHRQSAAIVLDQGSTGIFLLPNGHSRMLVGFREGFEIPLDLPPFPGASELADRGIYSYHLFPNTSFVFGGARSLMFLISSWPLATNRSRFDVHFLAATPADGPHADDLRTIIEANWSVFEEDLANLPFQQRAVDAGAIDAFPLSYQERRIYHQHEEIDRRIGAGAIPGSLRVEPVLEDWIER